MPTYPVCLLAPSLRVLGQGLLGALGTQDSLSSGSSRTDGRDTASFP